jgi:hypothetical protein
MALHQTQLEGDAARDQVRRLWLSATSTYIGAASAEVYVPESGRILGQAESDDFAVEFAWIAAACSIERTEQGNARSIGVLPPDLERKE